ncbi:MAG: hypothetical protein WCJ30_05935, partial [Deltaproteobacteria bacterium]
MRSWFATTSVVAICAFGGCTPVDGGDDREPADGATDAGEAGIIAESAGRTRSNLDRPRQASIADRALDRYTRDLPRDHLRDATATDFQSMARLVRQSTPTSASAWRDDLAQAVDGLPPTVQQRDALQALATTGIAELHVRWAPERGTPASLTGVGFLLRGSTPTAVWEAFRVAGAASLADLFGITAEDDFRVVQIDSPSQFDILRLARFRRGIPIVGESASVFVTNDSSSMGAGLLWRIDATLSRALGPMIAAERWINESAARSSAGGDTDVLASHQVLHCSASGCAPVWYVRVGQNHILTIDGTTGARISDQLAQGDAGPVNLGSYQPQSSSYSGVRYRRAGVWNGSTYLGATNADGTHAFTNSTPVSIGHVGAISTSGAWPSGRVDVRAWSAPNAANQHLVFWTPSTQSGRDFSAPDAWPSTPSDPTAPHQSEIAYG